MGSLRPNLVRLSELQAVAEIGDNDLILVSKKKSDGEYGSVAIKFSDFAAAMLKVLADRRRNGR